MANVNIQSESAVKLQEARDRKRSVPLNLVISVCASSSCDIHEPNWSETTSAVNYST